MTVFPLTADGAREYTSIGAGRPPSIFTVLGQDRYWLTADERVVEIESMGSDHARRVLAFLRRRAPLLPMQHVAMSIVVLSGLNGEMATDIAERELDREFDEILAGPDAWLEARPLVRKLVAVIARYEYVGQGPDWWE